MVKARTWCKEDAKGEEGAEEESKKESNAKCKGEKGNEKDKRSKGREEKNAKNRRHSNLFIKTEKVRDCEKDVRKKLYRKEEEQGVEIEVSMEEGGYES